LEEDAVKKILGAAARKRSRTGAVVVTQNEPAQRLYMVASGQARYFYLTRDGRKLILKWLRPGEIFGAAALMPFPSVYLVSTEITQQGELLYWERPVIRTLAMEHPVIWENTLLVALEYLTLYVATHSALVSQTAQRRLASILITLSQGMGQRTPQGIELHIRNEELADAANLTPFTTSRILRQWHRQGAIDKGRGKIVLRSPAALLTE
jgi:CRP-like cAMP-binding protein